MLLQIKRFQVKLSNFAINLKDFNSLFCNLKHSIFLSSSKQSADSQLPLPYYSIPTSQPGKYVKHGYALFVNTLKRDTGREFPDSPTSHVNIADIATVMTVVHWHENISNHRYFTLDTHFVRYLLFTQSYLVGLLFLVMRVI